MRHTSGTLRSAYGTRTSNPYSGTVRHTDLIQDNEDHQAWTSLQQGSIRGPQGNFTLQRAFEKRFRNEERNNSRLASAFDAAAMFGGQSDNYVKQDYAQQWQISQA